MKKYKIIAIIIMVISGTLQFSEEYFKIVIPLLWIVIIILWRILVIQERDI